MKLIIHINILILSSVFIFMQNMHHSFMDFPGILWEGGSWLIELYILPFLVLLLQIIDIAYICAHLSELFVCTWILTFHVDYVHLPELLGQFLYYHTFWLVRRLVFKPCPYWRRFYTIYAVAMCRNFPHNVSNTYLWHGLQFLIVSFLSWLASNI